MTERKKPGPPRQPIKHGTTSGARTHYRHGVPLCDACREAVRAANGNKPFRPAECGSLGGYRKHLRLAEEPCAACRDANREGALTSRKRRSQERKLPWDSRHGSAAFYKNHGCRCRPCTAANSRASADRRKRLKDAR